jgi:hypothetical protein
MKALTLTIVLTLGLGLTPGLAVPARAAEAISRTYAAPIDRVWSTTEAVLKVLGWKLDKVERGIGWITTESRLVEGEDYGVYAKGTRHRLRVNVRAADAGQTQVSVERTLFKRERILWMDKDEPLTPTDHTVEQGVLDAIGKSL